jgi:hypothetical protein
MEEDAEILARMRIVSASQLSSVKNRSRRILSQLKILDEIDDVRKALNCGEMLEKSCECVTFILDS